MRAASGDEGVGRRRNLMYHRRPPTIAAMASREMTTPMAALAPEEMPFEACKTLLGEGVEGDDGVGVGVGVSFSSKRSSRRLVSESECLYTLIGESYPLIICTTPLDTM